MVRLVKAAGVFPDARVETWMISSKPDGGQFDKGKVCLDQPVCPENEQAFF